MKATFVCCLFVISALFGTVINADAGYRHLRSARVVHHVAALPRLHVRLSPRVQIAHHQLRGGHGAGAAVNLVGHRTYDPGQIVSHPSGCPRSLFCGCGTSVRLFGHPVRDLYSVSNWYRFRRVAAAPGTAAIFGRSHVAAVESVNGDGTVTLYDPNSGGGMTRVRRVSIVGLVFVNPHSDDGSGVGRAHPRHYAVAARYPRRYAFRVARAQPATTVPDFVQR